MEALQKLYDFREVELPEALFALTWDPAAVEAQVEDVKVRFLTIEETCGPVEEGDFAVFLLPAEGEQKEKTVQVNVGKHFHNVAFEKSLIGLSVGAEIAMPAREGGRRGVLVSLKRRKLAELSDALIARMGIEGVETIEEYREMHKQKLIARDKKKKTDALCNLVKKKVVEGCVFGSLEEAIEKQFASYDRQIAAMSKVYGMDSQAIRDGNTPPQYDTPEKKAAYWRERAENEAKLNLIATAYAAQVGRIFGQADYETKCQEYLAQGVTPQQLEAQFSYEVYRESAYVEFYNENILSYFDNRFKVVEPA